ncbi:MAG: right-handed parallel beta-helix repeat-containing protein [Planctomycetota bacterium]
MLVVRYSPAGWQENKGIVVVKECLSDRRHKTMKRTLFCKRISAAVFMLVFSGNLFAQGNSKVEGLVNPKHRRQVITVGGQQADIQEYTSDAIQIALDAINTRGGGLVKLNPGKFLITSPVRLYRNTALVGSGKETVLQKCDGFRTNFVVDADYGMLKATVKDVSGFEVGMGIQLFDDEHNSGWAVMTAKITDIIGNVIFFDNSTVHDYIASKNGTVSNACSIVEGIGVEGVQIAHFVAEGNKSTNDYINGCRGGGIYLHKSRNCLIEGVKVNEFHGDSFSWQVTENITVRNCEACYGNGLGFHPGTGSDRTIIENCISHHNKHDGIFLCWRVQNGIFKDNVIYSNDRYGISIGHKDTDNIFTNNHVFENSRHGVYFRNETEQNSGHRNTFRNNIIENNGSHSFEAYGFYIGGKTHDILIENNVIRSTNKGNQVAAVCVGKYSARVQMEDNKISGCAAEVRE